MDILIGLVYVLLLCTLLYTFYTFLLKKKPAAKIEMGALIQATVCGHKTKVTDWVEAFGEKTKTTLPVKNGVTEYCHRCIEKMATRCAWCGGVIFIGDPVTLYIVSKEKEMPEYAVLYNKEDNSYVGCLGVKCADTGADRCGFWWPPGKVRHVPSAIEMCMQDVKKGGNGFIVIEDLSKP